MTGGRSGGHDPASGTDSAGMPWAGRTLAATGFEGDPGLADPALVAAMTGRDDERRLVAAIAAARLLVPVVAVPGEVDRSRPAAHEVGSDMAAVTLVRPDGATALPVFSSVSALAGWDPSARPVPVSAQRAALAAVQQGCQEMVLDPRRPAAATALAESATPREPPPATPYVLRGSMVRALARGRPWLPAHEDPLVVEAVRLAVRTEQAVHDHRLGAGRGGALQ